MEASWGDYDATMTFCQVQSIFRPDAKDAGTTTGISSQVVSFAPFLYSSNKEKEIVNKSVEREKRNRVKYHTWVDYREYLLNRHPKEWYGVFDDSGVCCKCGLTVVDSFNLHVHHLSYVPVKTSFIHAGCHNPEYHYTEKLRREERIDKYAPKICIVGPTRITCYFKKCDDCKLKVWP